MLRSLTECIVFNDDLRTKVNTLPTLNRTLEDMERDVPRSALTLSTGGLFANVNSFSRTLHGSALLGTAFRLSVVGVRMPDEGMNGARQRARAAIARMGKPGWVRIFVAVFLG